MTIDAVIAHWRKGARESLRLAQLAAEKGMHKAALSHCHLAVEQALKAKIMAITGKPLPIAHDLVQLASLVTQDWPEDERMMLVCLSDLAIAAQRDDPLGTAAGNATETNALTWISFATEFLSAHLP